MAIIISSDDINPEEQIKNGISPVDLGNCIDELKKYYNISDNESLILVNMESKLENSNSDDKAINLGKNTEIDVYDYSGRKLNISICKEEIKIMKLIDDFTQIDINSAKSLSEQGVDVFNPKDEFFNNICHQYENTLGTDIILNDRRTDIYQNVTFCQDGCSYNGVNYSLMVANCLCDSSSLQVDNNNITRSEIDKEENTFKSFTKSFIENLFSFNFEVTKCYNLILNKKILANNIGFYCLSSMVTLQLIFLFIYLIKRLKPVKNFMINFIMNNFRIANMNYNKNNKNINHITNINKKKKKKKSGIKAMPPPKNNFPKKNNKKENSNKKKKKVTKSKITESKPNKNNDIDLKFVMSKNNIDSIISISRNENKDYGLKLLDSDKLENSEGKNIIISQNFSSIINIQTPIINIKNYSKKESNLITTNKIKKQKDKKNNNNDKIYNIESNKKQNIKRNIFEKSKNNNNKDIHHMETILYKNNNIAINPKINKECPLKLSINDSNIQDLDYEAAIIYDKRTYLSMFWGFMVDSQIIFGTLCTENNLDLFVIKLSFLIFTFQISFFLNALFYTDEYISNAYHNEGILDFFSGLPKSVYSFIATLVTTNLLRMLSSSKSELLKLLKHNNNMNSSLNMITIKLEKLQKKLIIYFILLFILQSFFLYYVTAFCSVYRYSQKYWFLGCLESFGMDFLVSLISCIFLALCRYISIKKHIKCFYVLAGIVSTFL